eukprot:TRINITY_DN6674_c0_g1_i2.p1 TRINITY_DN6674_c0_g1~~TRINITY_DN6674_c0_g1_i2.p1  ORF type:complete len:349 (-),score=70.18 TRINITY_DN6674_c0_g1_i2:121-1167(-)
MGAPAPLLQFFFPLSPVVSCHSMPTPSFPLPFTFYVHSAGFALIPRSFIAWLIAVGCVVGCVVAFYLSHALRLPTDCAHGRNAACSRLASASKDGTVRIWNAIRGAVDKTLSGHSMAVTCVKWGGSGLIYSASEDRTILVFNADRGTMVRKLAGHGHWVNIIALNTDYVMRTGAFDHTGVRYDDPEQAKAKALERYEAVTKGKPEKLASGSDDHTIFLWEPETGRKPITRLTGHQQPINWVSYSPDGRLLASASFDQSLKLWNGITGKFFATLRGHVQRVYQVCWSSDSRLVVSGSQDSTLKVWDLKTGKLKVELPGHADEVYAVDWAPDGQHVASGGKDRVLKLWKS